MIVARLAFIALLAQGLAAPQSAATVEGTVVQSGSGQPAAGARVQLFHTDLQRVPGGPPSGRNSQPLEPDDLTPRSAVTGQDGRFVFENVKPGEYRLVALLSGGYVPGEFGQRSATGLGIRFDLAPGEQMRGVQLVVTPTGTISGRAYDRDGPVGKLQVQALRPVYRNGRRTLTIVQSVQTDDRGEYRLFWLPPGSYYVEARPFYGGAGPKLGSDPLVTSAVHITEPTRVGTFEQASSPVVTSRTLPDGEVIDEVQVPVYYPGTTEPGEATRIDLRAGANAEGIDIAVTTGAIRLYRLRGVLLANGQPVAARVTAVPRTSQPSLTLPGGLAGPDGSFDIAGLLPGPYFVFGRTNSGLSGVLALQIGDGDIDNLVIQAIPGARLAGRFIVDGHSRAGTDLDLASLRVLLRRDPDVIGMPEGGPAFSPPPAPDGSFELQGVQPGDYRVSLRALPPDAYIKSMRMGATDVLDDGLHISGSPRDGLEIVIGANGGTLAGTVGNARQEPLSNITVAIVPGPADRQRTYLYKSATSDRSGRFEIRGLAPGSYEAFAWDNLEDGAWLDPDFISLYERQGKSVRIRDGADENLQLTVISGR